MILTIYGNGNVKKMEVSPDDSSAHTSGIQEDDVLSLSFTSYEYVILAVNDYVDFEGGRYWLQDRFLPVEKNEQEWKYDLKLYGLSSLIKRFLILNVVGGTPNAVFTLTAPAREHVALIVKSINDGFGTTDWKVGEVVDTENLLIDYEGTYCNEGLEMVAKKAEVEYWIDGTTVNLTRCEYGEEVSLGYDKGLTELEPAKADGVKLYTRLFPIGSSRNIDPEKYGFSRLQLPGGVKYVDINTDKYGIIHHYEQDAFADIYPKRIGTVSSVRSEKTKDKNGKEFTIWYFKDENIDFNPNEHELPKENKRVSFQSGELQGLGTGDEHFFEVNYDDKNKEFEIITIWPDDNEQLPGGMLVPRQGDTYILWNIRMPDSYIRAAEQEYRKAVDEYNAKHAKDVTVYKAPTDHVYIEEKKIELYPGRRVRLESAKYFPEGFRSSRILKISQKVNCPSQMDIEIGDALSTGKMDQVSDRIEDVKNYVKKSPANQYEVVKSWEKTPPTDYNLASFKMVLKQISGLALSKLEPDTALGLIKFLGGLDFGEVLRSLGAVDSFISGKGTILTKDGRIQTDRLEVRNSMKVLELIINRIQGMENDFVFAPTRKVVNVEKIDETAYKLVLDPLRDGDLIPFREGNILYSIVNDLLAGGNSYYTSYMRVLTTNQNDYSITVSLYPDSEVPGGQNHIPVAGYNISRRGDVHLPEEGQSNPDAQSWYLSSTEGRLLFLQNVIKPVLDDYNYALSVGKFPRIQAIDNLPISTDDVGIMAKTIVCEKLYRYDYNGDIISNKVDRGEWSLPVAMSSNPYRFIRHEKVYPDGIHQYTELEQHTVYHHGCKWGCLVDKTTEEPRWNARSWVLLEGDKNYILTFESSNGWQYRLNQVETDIKAVVVYANQDISDNLFVTTGVEVEWLRDTGNVASDNSWKPAYVGGKKDVIHLTSADMGSGWGAEYRKVSFVCRVFIPAGEDYQRIENRINIKL